MPETEGEITNIALGHFQSARLKGDLERVRAALTGKSADLLSYEEVRQRLGAMETSKRELREIPLDAIVGSLGRYKDFTRHFLPRVEEDQHRWARVRALVESMDGLPPIEVFQIGEVYFVRDGNHRVSVARDMEVSQIEAYVTLVETKVPLTPDVDPDDLIIKERYASFLSSTRLDEAYPDIDMSMSVAGNYRLLEQQIAVHQHWLSERDDDTLSYAEAAAHWYKTVYWPTAQVIWKRGVLREFPERTVTDMYVWLYKYRVELAERLGWSVETDSAVSNLITSFSQRPTRVVHRVSEKLKDVLTPDALEAGPAPGAWRSSWLAAQRTDRIFSHILVAVDGTDKGWLALQQATRVARREQSHLYGLHVIPKKGSKKKAKKVKKAFEQRCLEAGVSGECSIERGNVMRLITDRARWSDLVVVSLAHPPGPTPVERLSSGFSQLLRRCPRPVMAVPRTGATLDRLLLAYDGSPKAEEALFVATYLAEQWEASLVLVTATGKEFGPAIAQRAQEYLADYGITPTAIDDQGTPVETIMEAARTHDCGLIIMGGYGLGPMREILTGSLVDELLRARNRPVLICR